jgi:hypothetical protein
MLCMCCGQVFEQTYFVSKEAAVGTPIQGPLVCMSCYIKNFPNQRLPNPAYIDQLHTMEPVKMGTPLPVNESSPVGMSFSSPRVHAVRHYSLEEALQKIADENLTSCKIFTWGPHKYNKLWAQSIKDKEVIEYSLRSGKESCAQGLGVYMAQTIHGSYTYANTHDTSVLMLICNNTPTIDYSTRMIRIALASKISELTGIEIDEKNLQDYMNETKCHTRAIKKYGNYWAVTTGVGVVPTFDYQLIFEAAKKDGFDRVKRGSPHGAAYLTLLEKSNPHSKDA